jgi:cytochrome P450
MDKQQDTPEYRRHLAVKNEVYAVIHDEMDKRQARFAAGETPVDLVSLMVAAAGQDGITRKMVADNLMNLFLGALDTTTKWIGNILVVLKRHPETLAEVQTDRRLLTQAAEEVMRLETVAQMLLRLVRADGTEFGGQRMRAGDKVYTMLGVANHDSEMFEDAGVLKIHREQKLQLGFGFGMHQCLGVHLARLEAVGFMDVLLDMFPALQIASCDYGESWALWGPRRLHVRLA